MIKLTKRQKHSIYKKAIKVVKKEQSKREDSYLCIILRGLLWDIDSGAFMLWLSDMLTIFPEFGAKKPRKLPTKDGTAW